MKTYLLTIITITISLIFFSCDAENNNKESQTKVEENILNENFDWLLGNWKRNNDEEGKDTYEVWTKVNNSEYHGIGYTMQESDTISQEQIRLVNTGGKWNLEVQAPEDPNPIIFNMTSYNEQEFICENKALDFPKLIKYWKNGSKINALVSGDDLEISFEFERN